MLKCKKNMYFQAIQKPRAYPRFWGNSERIKNGNIYYTQRSKMSSFKVVY